MSERTAGARVGWVDCPGCGALLALEAARCEACGLTFRAPVPFPEDVQPPRLTIGLLMLLMVPVAVLLAVVRFSSCLGVGLLYLFVLAIPRTRRVLAIERSRGGPVSQFEIVPAFLGSVCLIVFLTVSCAAAFGLPIIVGSTVAWLVGELYAWGDHETIQRFAITGAILGGGLGPILMFRVHRYILKNLWYPHQRPASRMPRYAPAPRQRSAPEFALAPHEIVMEITSNEHSPQAHPSEHAPAQPAAAEETPSGPAGDEAWRAESRATAETQTGQPGA